MNHICYFTELHLAHQLNHYAFNICYMNFVFRFPKYMPPGLFEMFSVRAHKEKHKLKFLSHWGTGFYARHRVDKLQVFL